MSKRCRTVILISGSGTNLQAFLDAAREPDYPLDIVGVISDNADAFGLTRAERAGVATAVVSRERNAPRAAFDTALAKAVNGFAPSLVILAGFMRIIAGELIEQYAGRMLNIHPALLPRYKGLHTHRRALEHGDREHGTTVHFVTAQLDDGPSILQAALRIRADDDEASLSARVQAMEHKIYPLVGRWFGEKRLRMHADCAILDDKPLNAPLVLQEDELC